MYARDEFVTFVVGLQVWLPASKGKGLEISGTMSHRNNQVLMDLTLTNKAMQPMTGFAAQFNKNRYVYSLWGGGILHFFGGWRKLGLWVSVNICKLTILSICSFGLIPASQMNVASPLMPSQSINTSIPLNLTGPVQRMEPLTQLQVAIKNNIDVFYFSCMIPMQALFVEDGEMDKRVFLATWKDIPAQNEVQYEIRDVQHNAGNYVWPNAGHSDWLVIAIEAIYSASGSEMQ